MAAGARFRCLIFDHDDTCVESTASIHYPAHCAGVQELLPGHSPVSLEGWFQVNHDPGVGEYLRSLFGRRPPHTGEPIPEEEYAAIHKRELEIWREFMAERSPDFVPGILDLMKEFREEVPGGVIAVVSHSPADVIKKHYAEKGEGVEPDMIWGWREDKSENKPNPWPCERIIERFSLGRDECLVIDDLTPGVKMAVAADIKAVAAAWCHTSLVGEMRGNGCSEVLYSVEELRKYVFGA